MAAAVVVVGAAAANRNPCREENLAWIVIRESPSAKSLFHFLDSNGNGRQFNLIRLLVILAGGIAVNSKRVKLPKGVSNSSKVTQATVED